ncbi:queuosine precursor transporter [candidate division WOR-3 bacterium]|nr:queuosine precursor transporter [candidate division WOR-3 bacterium]
MTESDRQSGLVSVAVVSAAYIAAQMLSDIASLRIVVIAGFSVDAGTLIYPFTFTLRDLVHKTAGIKTARWLIVAAAVINLLMAGLFWLVTKLPPDMQVGAQLEFGRVLSPVWRIVIASIVAEVVSELVDGEVYQLWVNRIGMKLQWMRVLTSNSVSVPLDSALFCGLAFVGRMPFAVVMSIFLANIIAKGITTIISLPWIYLVRERKIKPEVRIPGQDR